MTNPKNNKCISIESKSIEQTKLEQQNWGYITAVIARNKTASVIAAVK